VDFHQFVLAWRSSKTEFAIMTCTFVVTLAVGIDKGIMAGVALSLLALVRRSSHPSVKVLGVIPGTSTFRDVKRYPHAYQVPTVRIMRVDESLHFASCLAVKEQILQLAAEGADHMPPIILLDCSGINFIDMSGIRVGRAPHRRQLTHP
jgi:SulP family sulfate permease